MASIKWDPGICSSQAINHRHICQCEHWVCKCDFYSENEESCVMLRELSFFLVRIMCPVGYRKSFYDILYIMIACEESTQKAIQTGDSSILTSYSQEKPGCR